MTVAFFASCLCVSKDIWVRVNPHRDTHGVPSGLVHFLHFIPCHTAFPQNVQHLLANDKNEIIGVRKIVSEVDAYIPIEASIKNLVRIKISTFGANYVCVACSNFANAADATMVAQESADFRGYIGRRWKPFRWFQLPEDHQIGSRLLICVDSVKSGLRSLQPVWFHTATLFRSVSAVQKGLLLEMALRV